MMINDFKFELFKGLVFVAVGAYLGQRFAPEDKKPEIKQEQTAKCKAIITKRQNADGSHDEVTEFLSESSQKQEVISKVKNKALFLGAGTDKKLSIDFQNDKQLHQITTDGNKDHAYYFKYKVMEF